MISNTENELRTKEAKSLGNSIEIDADLLSEQENKASLSSIPSQKRKVLKSNWWNVLWGLVTLFVCFVSITTFGFVASDEPWAGCFNTLTNFCFDRVLYGFKLCPS